LTSGAIRKLRRIWRLPPFAAYLLAICGWFFGSGLQTALFPGVINFTLQESPARLGLAQAALTAPMLLLLPFAGVIAERMDRRLVMTGFHIIAAAAAGLLALALLHNWLSYNLLLIYALVVGAAGAFVMPARDSAVNGVTRVARRMGRPGFTLQKAVILASLVQFAAQIAGMAAGFLASLFGPGPLFAAQCAGLLIGGAGAMLMPRLHTGSAGHDPILKSLFSGVATVARSPVLLPMTLIMLAVGLFIVGGGFFVIVPVLVHESYDGGYGLLSLLLVAFWTGAFAANVILARMGSIERPGRALLGAQLVSVAAMGALSVSLPLPALFVMVFLWGLGAGVAISLSRAVVQEHAPPDMIARVMSVYLLGLFGGMPLGAFAMGYIVTAIGVNAAALIPMAGLLVVVIWIALATPILNVSRVAPGE